ncbi:hypothetical protein UAW_00330 [Enterococcus haemoperoxidus ATCC BAA-382]|uniref:Integral membrane protein n=1 Tax=Enterococcus haemoperoxidus ATCC BAA-382 TaxID=1158608 RepID=R2T4T9_9ENTE|nr:DUF975 family protein [Enterococcus haemoperoxidus]EOI00014.1 hypothetical protein UAW_00330 [Enterococcus haemoperoxidus ATCC BAA-382]EOT63078.1 hypothetical protein I583_02081 [Enterococcus haemoperoxidus ATCC BAA-382]
MKSQITNGMHREQARISLKNQWGTMAWITFLAVFIRFIIGSVIGSIANLPQDSAGSNFMSFLLNNFLFFAITYGTYYCALQVLRGKRVQAGMLTTIFQGKFYIPMLVINLIQYVVELLLNLIVLLPILLSSGVTMYFGLMFNTVSVEQFQSEMGGDIFLALLLLIFGFLMILVGIFVSGVFQFAVWVKLDDPELSVGDALKYALFLMKGRFGQYLLLQISFIGWFIIGALVFGIGLLWVIPYHDVAVASFYDTAREEKGAPLVVDNESNF